MIQVSVFSYHVISYISHKKNLEVFLARILSLYRKRTNLYHPDQSHTIPRIWYVQIHMICARYASPPQAAHDTCRYCVRYARRESHTWYEHGMEYDIYRTPEMSDTSSIRHPPNWHDMVWYTPQSSSVHKLICIWYMIWYVWYVSWYVIWYIQSCDTWYVQIRMCDTHDSPNITPPHQCVVHLTDTCMICRGTCMVCREITWYYMIPCSDTRESQAHIMFVHVMVRCEICCGTTWYNMISPAWDTSLGRLRRHSLCRSRFLAFRLLRLRLRLRLRLLLE